MVARIATGEIEDKVTDAVAAGLTDVTLIMTYVVTLVDKRDEERLGAKRAVMLDPQANLAGKLSYSN
jgi:hypothetical protein